VFDHSKKHSLIIDNIGTVGATYKSLGGNEKWGKDFFSVF